MKFKLLENIDKSYERFFHIDRNEAGNYCAYHNDDNFSHKRLLKDGNPHVDPFCWARRKADLVDGLNDLVHRDPVDAKQQFMSKNDAIRFGLHTYNGQQLLHKEMNENAVGDNNEINKKKYKRHSQSPFVRMNHGDPEVNRKAFNAASNVGKIPTSSDGMSGGDAGAGAGGGE